MFYLTDKEKNAIDALDDMCRKGDIVSINYKYDFCMLTLNVWISYRNAGDIAQSCLTIPMYNIYGCDSLSHFLGTIESYIKGLQRKYS